ncbi:hypothetical protein C2E23DRAFT_886118 [Lenzites betulinus]|nr:hypothetical protein C2E23DRAFT_886118 [Lenzites betulinus]
MSDSPPTIIVDNAGPGVQVTLSPSYTGQIGNVSEQAKESLDGITPNNNTLFFAANPGWNVEYTFFGNYIALFGMVLPFVSGDPAVATYAVDGTFQQTTVNPKVTLLDPDVALYTVQDLLLANHTLTVNITTASPDNPWVFDFLRVGPFPLPSSSASVATSSATSTSSTFSVSTTSQPTGTATSTSASGSATSAAASNSTQAFPTAIVAGSIAGGIAFAAILFALTWCLWMRSRRRRRRKQEEDGYIEKHYDSSDHPPVSAHQPTVAYSLAAQRLPNGAVTPWTPPNRHPRLSDLLMHSGSQQHSDSQTSGSSQYDPSPTVSTRKGARPPTSPQASNSGFSPGGASSLTIPGASSTPQLPEENNAGRTLGGLVPPETTTSSRQEEVAPSVHESVQDIGDIDGDTTMGPPPAYIP